MKTIAQKYIEEGEARGIHIGKVEGKAVVKEWQFCGGNC